jgi:hypothetical protein
VTHAQVEGFNYVTVWRGRIAEDTLILGKTNAVALDIHGVNHGARIHESGKSPSGNETADNSGTCYYRCHSLHWALPFGSFIAFPLLVAFAGGQDLLLCAKHLFVAARAGAQSGAVAGGRAKVLMGAVGAPTTRLPVAK